MFQILVCIIFILYFVNIIYKVQKSSPQWQPNVDESTFHLKITKSSFKATVFQLFLIIECCCGTVINVISSDRDGEIYFMIGWVEENILIMQRIFVSCLRITFVLCALVLPFPCAQLAYVMQHHRFQIYFLLHHLKNINENFNCNNSEELIFNERYQRTIQQRLIFCIRRHTELLILGQRMTSNSGLFIFFFAITGGIVVISILMFVTLVS